MGTWGKNIAQMIRHVLCFLKRTLSTYPLKGFFFTFKYSFMSSWLLSIANLCKNSLWQGSQLQHKPKPYCIIESKTKSKGTFPNPISFLYTPTCSFTWQIIVQLSVDSQTAIRHVWRLWISIQRKSLYSEESHLNINHLSPSVCSLSECALAMTLAHIRSLWFGADRVEQPSALAVQWDLSLAEALQFCAASLRSSKLPSKTCPRAGLLF